MDDSFASLAGRYRGNGVLVDTNVLLLLFVGQLERSLVSRFKRTRHFSPEDVGLLLRFLRRFDRLLVTPHILTEAAGLGNQLGEPARSAFYRKMASFLAEPPISGLPPLEELHVESRAFTTIGEHVYPRLGLTDSLTTVVAASRCLVLTDDLRLAVELQCRSYDVVNFNHLRAAETESSDNG